ncbi:uncharacterized protein LOC100121057 isoform X1 [Nasonia vitripennis]|uniref:Endosome-associated-trafficking regulator 1 n=2 Tax=Nasonia vitripennis TaxID=7425 RepID=A0A7M7QZD7_NASVI|nr:uncharacterized protein LOC100121057 isoform X1 [Nasonia vitripennis]
MPRSRLRLSLNPRLVHGLVNPGRHRTSGKTRPRRSHGAKHVIVSRIVWCDCEIYAEWCGGKSSTRREESLFSLKQFLKNDNQTNHQFAGARPKVYESQSRTPEPSENHDKGKYPRNPTELPDFVQDHLVIEQCFLSDKASSNMASVEVDNLPDFALNSVEQRHIRYLKSHSAPCDRWKKNSEGSGDLSFDLTDHLDKGPSNSPHPSSLDLPKLDVIDGELADVPESLGFPFDLQIPRGTESNVNADVAANHPLPEGIPNTTKLLPDFLSDAPIRTRGTPISDRPDCSSSSDSMNQWLSMENERLRNELQIARRQASERSLRIETLEAELLSRGQSDHTESANLEKAMEQVEDNLKRSTKRAINAESTVASLKKEIDSLSIEIMMLQTENRELRAAMGVDSNGCRNTNPDRRIRRLADDLRLAASTAEVSLRQLMSGVNNLRVLASALENVDKIEDRTKDFLPDFDEDNAAGPAL